MLDVVLQDPLFILTGLYNTFSASADFCHVHEILAL